MLVKVAPMGEVVREANVEAGSTVASILRIVGVSVNGRSIRVNNAEATESTTVNDDESIITLAQKMKGGR